MRPQLNQGQRESFVFEISEQLTAMFHRAKADKKYTTKLLKIKSDLSYNVDEEDEKMLSQVIDDVIFINQICSTNHYEFAKFLLMYANYDCEIDQYLK